MLQYNILYILSIEIIWNEVIKKQAFLILEI